MTSLIPTPPASSFLLSFAAIIWMSRNRPRPGPAGYHRVSSIHGNTIIYFTAEGDLWLVGNRGSWGLSKADIAPGVDFPPPLPDAPTVAFSAETPARLRCRTMPAGGGVPRRCTPTTGNASVIGWTNWKTPRSSFTRHLMLPNPQPSLFHLGGNVGLIGCSALHRPAMVVRWIYALLHVAGLSREPHEALQWAFVENIWRLASGYREAV